MRGRGRHHHGGDARRVDDGERPWRRGRGRGLAGKEADAGGEERTEVSGREEVEDGVVLRGRGGRGQGSGVRGGEDGGLICGL